MNFTHLRHKPPSSVSFGKELILAIPQLRSNVNVARILRAAGCTGITQAIVAGKSKIDAKIARDSLEVIHIERHRSLRPALVKLKNAGYSIIGLEQVEGSTSIYEFKFPSKAVLVVGHERLGIDDATLKLLDAAIEIPVYGRPLSYNVATATSIALYEFGRQAACP